MYSKNLYMALCTQAALMAAQLTTAQQPNATQAAANQKLADQAMSHPTPHIGGHPDLSGFWFIPGRTNIAAQVAGAATTSSDGKTVQLDIAAPQDVARFEVEPVAHRRADGSTRPSYKPEYAAKALDNFDHANQLDPAARCTPPGVPRIGVPAEISQRAGVTYLLYTARNYYRVIPTDGRPHDADADEMSMGDPVGHWDGDAFVVDSVNFSDDTWLDGDGSFHTSKMHVIERFTRKGDTLRWEATVEDPAVMTAPWSPKAVVMVAGSAKQHVAQDYPCIDKDSGHYVNGNRH